MHPLAIAAVAFVVCALLLVKVVPEFQQCLDNLISNLPALTLKVINFLIIYATTGWYGLGLSQLPPMRCD